MLNLFFESLQIAIKSIRSNKLRSVLTTLGVVIGVSSVIAMVSLIQGLRSGFLKQVQKAGSQTIFIEPVPFGSINSEEFNRIKSRDLTLDEGNLLSRSTPQIASITPLLNTPSTLTYKGKKASSTLIITDESYLEENDLTITDGRAFAPTDIRLGNKVAVIGPKLIQKLDIKSPIGDYITIAGLSLEIIGILESQGASIGTDLDDRILIPISTGMHIVSDDQKRQMSFQARLHPHINVDDGITIISSNLRKIKGLKQGDREGFQVYNLKQMLKVVNRFTAAITLVTAGMLSIALLVGGIGIMNIMLVSVTERTREIGIRRAIGARQIEILAQFLTESALISLLGGAIGLVIGYTIGAILSKITTDTITPIPAWVVMIAFLIPVSIGLIFGLYPANKASKLDPIESLRYE